MFAQLKRLRKFARVPLIAKPNAGMPKIVDGKTVYDCPPDEFTAFVQPMLLPVDAKHGKVLDVTSEFEDTLAEELDTDDAMVAVKLSGWENIDTFADCQYMINKPLCIVCDNADILESALRVYQGRALYEGALSEEELLPLCDKYGLII